MAHILLSWRNMRHTFLKGVHKGVERSFFLRDSWEGGIWFSLFRVFFDLYGEYGLDCSFSVHLWQM